MDPLSRGMVLTHCGYVSCVQSHCLNANVGVGWFLPTNSAGQSHPAPTFRVPERVVQPFEVNLSAYVVPVTRNVMFSTI